MKDITAYLGNYLVKNKVRRITLTILFIVTFLFLCLLIFYLYTNNFTNVFNNKELNKYVSYVPCSFNDRIRKNRKALYFDREGIRSYLEEYNSNAIKSRNAYIIEAGGHYAVIDEIYGEQVDIDKVLLYMDILGFVELEKFYIQPKVKKEDIKLAVAEANSRIDWCINYSNGQSISSGIEYVYINRDGKISIDNSFIDRKLREVLAGYEDINKGCSIVATDTDKPVDVVGGNWGMGYMDYNSELEFAREAFLKGNSYDNREPDFTFYKPVGNTYLEISIGSQHAWYYEQGKLILDTDIVTGNCDGRYDTPTGAYTILEKDKERELVSPSLPGGIVVDRWIRLTWEGIGLHDAKWREEFGGNIYRTNGSHGCVNMPRDFTHNLFNRVEVGTIVVIHD